MAKHKIKQLDLEQLRRGIYIDFEGLKDKAPLVLGEFVEEQFELYVLNPKLQRAAAYSQLEYIELHEIAFRLFQKAIAESRYLIAWSEHELKVVLKYTELDITSRYYDAKRGAKQWLRRNHPDLPTRPASLARFMQLTGFRAGHGLGKGHAGSRLRDVLKQLENRDSFNALTRTSKGKWTHLLRYNRQDCEALRHITLTCIATDKQK